MAKTLSRTRVLASVCKESFWQFCCAFWEEVPGAGKMIPNWHMEFLCSELDLIAQRIFKGQKKEYDFLCNISPGTSKSTISSILLPCWLWTRMPECRILTASHTDELVLDLANKSRAVLLSELYQTCFPYVLLSESQNSKGYYVNTKGGDRKTCTIAGKSPTGFHAHCIICDDPLDPKKAMSEAELKVASYFYDAVLPGRKVNKEVSVELTIQQRVHVDDPSGHLLERSRREGTAAIRHVCLPAELLKGDDGEYVDTNVHPKELAANYVDGLMDPHRLPHSVLKRERATMGLYSYCTPGFSPILMSDWTEKKVAEIKIGDEVVGYQPRLSEENRDKSIPGWRAKLVKSKVVSISQSIQMVVKITMQSGRKVYCTPDHCWWTGRSIDIKSDGTKRDRTYRPAAVRLKNRSGYGTSILQSVYTPFKPTPEEQRCLDWLGGMLDGEGSCCSKSVFVHQSPYANPEVWAEIKTVLDLLGIKHRVTKGKRVDYMRRKRARNSDYYFVPSSGGPGCYHLHGGRSMKFKLLNFAHMAKKQRILDSIWRAPGNISEYEDTVVSIEPIGEMEVFGLTTTSGNYVAWGYASQNSSQFLQAPQPLGGGMFREKFFNARCKAAPYKAKRVRFWDKAGTSNKKSANTSGTLMAKDAEGNFYIENIVVGQWLPDERDDIILATAYRDRTRYGPKNDPDIYIEQEPGSAGIDSFRHIARKLAGFRVYADRPTGKKEIRAEPLAGQLAAGNVLLVEDNSWDIGAFIEECLAFPNGHWKDRVDSTSGAFNRLVNVKQCGTLHILKIGDKSKKTTLRLVVGSQQELQYLNIEQLTLLTLFHDYPLGEIITTPTQLLPPLPVHGLANLRGSHQLVFADLDPAHLMNVWNEKHPVYQQPYSELVISKTQGKSIWNFLLRKRDVIPGVWVFADQGQDDGRALSTVLAICDCLRLSRQACVYKASDEDWRARSEDKPPNQFVYDVVKTTRELTMW